MKLLFGIFVFYTFLALTQCSCQLHINMKPFENIKTDHSLIYIYVPLQIVGLAQNSIEILNEYGQVLDCLNMEDFKEDIGLSWDTPCFTMMEHISHDLYLIVFVSDENPNAAVRNNAHAVIVDEYFNVRESFNIIEMSPNVESSIFKPDAIANMHEIIVTKNIKYAIMIVREYHTVTDVQKYFPDSSVESKTLSADGFCVLDLKTGKEAAALSGDGLVVEYDNWIEYITEAQYDDFYVDDSTSESQDSAIDIGHLNSIELVDGSHFSLKYINVNLILFTSFNQETAYLIKWDFENESDPVSEVLWKLPGPRALEKIRNEWTHRWEFVNDPFKGFSITHDINVENAPIGHFLVYDNGSGHRVSNNPYISCPMSRALEYKVEMDVDGKKGYNRITLVFSYPKVEDYPKFIYFENEPSFIQSECEYFWEHYNWQRVYGSFRRTENGYYVLTDYSYNIFSIRTEGESRRMLKLNSDGDIVSGWDTINGDIISYRIIPLDMNSFRHGLYNNKALWENNQISI